MKPVFMILISERYDHVDLLVISMFVFHVGNEFRNRIKTYWF